MFGFGKNPDMIVLDVVCRRCHRKFKWEIAKFSARTDVTCTESEYYRDARAGFACEKCTGSSPGAFSHEREQISS